MPDADFVSVSRHSLVRHKLRQLRELSQRNRLLAITFSCIVGVAE
jgi:hypothetical protein